MRTSASFFEGRVRHRRFETKNNQFSLGVFYTLIDVDAPQQLDSVRRWSSNDRAFYHYQEKDFGPRGHNGLSAGIRDLVEEELHFRPKGKVLLLTNVRNLGYVFNPISIYFLLDESDALEAVILEVTNTPWNDRHHYVIDGRGSDGTVTSSFKKAMHVSPFFDMEFEYQFRLQVDNDKINVKLVLDRNGEKAFDADLNLAYKEFNNANARHMALRYPLQNHRISGAIYLHALMLWLKRVPFVSSKSAGSHEHKVSVGNSERTA